MKKIVFLSSTFAVVCLAFGAVDVPGLLRDVNLFVGTEGEGNMTPAAAYPNGMLNPGPDTSGEKDAPCSGYRYSDTSLVGFSQWHLNGTGHPGLGDVLLYPFCGETADRDDTCQRILDHRKEFAVPGYYSLETRDIRSEMTTSRRANVFRFSRLRGDRPVKLLVDLEYCLRRRNNDGRGIDVRTNVTELAENHCGLFGWTDKKTWGERTFSYALEFNVPWTNVECVSEKGAKAPKYVFSFDELSDGALMAKVAFSFGRDPATARKNLIAEIPGWDFDGVRTQAASAWNEVLSRVEVEGPSKVRRMFYTSLYHVYAQPNLSSDIGLPDRYTLFSLWDTFRSAHPLYERLVSERVPDFVNSLLDHFDRYGYLPRWELWGCETNCMIGDHAVQVIVDAWQHGFKGFDVERAYRAVRETLTTNRRKGNPGYYPPREERDLWEKYGYFPCDLVTRESVSRTLESAHDDYRAYEFAKGLGKAEDAAFFERRSWNFTNLFDRATLCFRPKDSRGRFLAPFSPAAGGRTNPAPKPRPCGTF